MLDEDFNLIGTPKGTDSTDASVLWLMISKLTEGSGLVCIDDVLEWKRILHSDFLQQYKMRQD